MKFLFDANLPPALAGGMRELCTFEDDVDEVVHLFAKFPRNCPDLTWIPALGSDWYIVSQDKFAKSKGGEREALRRAGHTVYVLDPAWCSHPFWIKSAQLVDWWPDLLAHARLTQGGVYRVPWRRSSSKKFISL